MRKVTARQAMTRSNEMAPSVQKAMKASKLAAKERAAIEREAQLVEMYGQRCVCTKCGLHFRTHDNRSLCLDCM